MSEGSVPTFSRIYESYHARVRAYAAKLLGDDETDDVTQEVFLKIERSLASLGDPAKLTSWIYAITLNAVRDAARKRSARPERAQGLATVDDEATEPSVSRLPDLGSRTPEENAIRKEMVACFADFVKELPESYYEVYVLHELEQLSNREIARRLSLSEGTVKIRLHRARARLHEELRRRCRCYYDEHGELMGAPRG